MEIRTAILIDGSFFIKRVQHFHKKYFAANPDLTPQNLISILNAIKAYHLQKNLSKGKPNCFLYRCFYYDAAPLSIKAHYPITVDCEHHPRLIDFSKLPESICRNAFFALLKKQRKTALRLGHVKYYKQWNLKPKALSDLIDGSQKFQELKPEDFYYESQQKGVDIKLGVDIATLAYDKLVDQIILIAGDSDFVPAAKLARTKGIDFILNPLHNNIDPSLDEHIDGLNNPPFIDIISKTLKQTASFALQP